MVSNPLANPRGEGPSRGSKRGQTGRNSADASQQSVDIEFDFAEFWQKPGQVDPIRAKHPNWVVSEPTSVDIDRGSLIPPHA